jgi:small subunit ribosomal protein S1
MNTDTSINQSPSDEDHAEQAPTVQGLDEYLTDKYNYQVPRRGDIRMGVVMEMNEQGVVMDIGSKREGLVPAEDLTRLDEETRSQIQAGASVRVFVIRTADMDGRPVLSIHQACLYEDWIEAERMMGSGELYEGEISSYNRGGVIVKFGKIRGFVPASQIVGLPRRLREEQRRQRLEAMIGQRVGLKIIEVDRQRRRLIFSQRRAVRAWQELQRERVMAELTEGETRQGKVTSITDFGAFVDLGGADGLIHVSELSWSRVENPREVLRIGDEVDVYILNVDQQRKRIALSLKKLQPDPWTLVDDRYSGGQLIEGRVTRVLDFGAFIELDLGVEGLLHAREMMGTPELSPSDIVQPNETILVKIIRIDSRRRRLDLSAKQVRQDEWERWAAEQQAVQESQEAEEEAAVLEEEIAVSEAVVIAEAAAAAEEETAAPEPEAETTEAAEEEAAAPDEEMAVSEAVEPAEEETAAPEPEAEITEAAEEEAAAPEEEIAVSEAVEPAEAPAAAEEETAAPEPEAETSEVAEEEAAVPEEEMAVSEETEDETNTPEAE